jgi:hypothetical protein
MRDSLVKLKARVREAGIPVLYVNDNFGDWRSEKEVLMGRRMEAKGGDFVRPLLPDSEDYFVLKPMHSASIDPIGGSPAASSGRDPHPYWNEIE